ncbi:hypothetical protein T10_91 [Trichinella papuae]|uniref:Uncharacterized protein n=1 Tax=Trichinella papuae TaxID=268474 RepID=A0A0V1M1X0_9BILA|nr:hypothetical protein T10_91 [Trichinella papuae]KRZ65780.1 hypothetical protein T10_91 [Trichinella papuae]
MLDMRSDGCGVGPHALYHQQQLKELKRMAAEDPRLVTEICDELASSASTSLDTAAYFPSWPLSTGQAAGSAAHCRADNNKIRCAIFNV